MYVCICKGITTKQVEQTAKQYHGKKTPKEICKMLGVADDCGICVLDALNIIDQKLTQQSQPKQK